MDWIAAVKSLLNASTASASAASVVAEYVALRVRRLIECREVRPNNVLRAVRGKLLNVVFQIGHRRVRRRLQGVNADRAGQIVRSVQQVVRAGPEDIQRGAGCDVVY